jgi:hypothetical protein
MLLPQVIAYPSCPYGAQNISGIIPLQNHTYELKIIFKDLTL